MGDKEDEKGSERGTARLINWGSPYKTLRLRPYKTDSPSLFGFRLLQCRIKAD